MRLALLSSDTACTLDLHIALEDAGHAVHLYDDAQHLLRDLGRESFDLLLIDGSAFAGGVPRYLRRILSVADHDVALILVNCRDNETLLADAFAQGADDFIRSGVRPREIAVRVDAVLRRRHPALYRREARLSYRPYTFDIEARTVHLLDTEITLTDKEFDLAVFMFKNQGRVFSRGHLLEAIWRSQGSVLTRTVDTHISRIRKRMMINEENGFRLVSAYGTGYRLERLNDTWVSPLLTVSLCSSPEMIPASHAPQRPRVN